MAKLRADGHNAEVEVRIAELEGLFSDEETDLRRLDAAESLDNWQLARQTGDPLVDAWEAAIARGETPDLEAAIA